HMRKQRAALAAGAVLIAVAPATAAITIDTSNPSDWIIRNGVLTLDWNSRTGHVFSAHLAGLPDDLIDVTNTQGGQPKGFYMDNTGLGGGATTAGFFQDRDRYIDWWITVRSGSTNPFTYSQHFVMAGGDSGLHVYFTVSHGPGDIAG